VYKNFYFSSLDGWGLTKEFCIAQSDYEHTGYSDLSDMDILVLRMYARVYMYVYVCVCVCERERERERERWNIPILRNLGRCIDEWKFVA
jgi:hypothetical protein